MGNRYHSVSMKIAVGITVLIFAVMCLMGSFMYFYFKNMIIRETMNLCQKNMEKQSARLDSAVDQLYVLGQIIILDEAVQEFCLQNREDESYAVIEGITQRLSQLSLPQENLAACMIQTDNGFFSSKYQGDRIFEHEVTQGMEHMEGSFGRMYSIPTPVGGDVFNYRLDIRSTAPPYHNLGTLLLVVKAVKAEADGFLYTITAEKGVILATGGFGANTKMVSQYDPSIDPSVNSSNMPCATGDGITMSEAVQANLIDMKYIQFYPTGVVSTGAQETDIPYTSDRIFVNKEGKRFVAEDERRDVQSQGIFAQTDGQCWVIAGTDNLKDSDTARKQAEKTVAEGKAFRADSLEELAALIKTDPAVLAKTVSDYNGFIDANLDTEFGRKLFGKKIQGAPYYAALRSPTLHHTCGGLEIDTHSRVINQSGEVIKGLYAAGEVTGGVHGSNRLGGNAITDITVFGRIAGTSAAEGK